MITKTTIFTSISDIIFFINSNNIQDNKKLLIQFFSATTDNEFIQTFQYFFKSSFPLSTFIGSTSDGIINNEKVYDKNDSLIIFTTFEKTTLISSFLEHEDIKHSFFESGKKLATEVLTKESKAMITFSDGIHTNGEEFLRGIEDINKSVVVSGGMAGDNGQIKETYVFDKYNITSNGAVAVSLNSKDLQVRTDYSFDWTPVGKRLLVTKSDKNKVYTIDNLTAVELYSRYLGEELASCLPQIGIEFPLILIRDGVSVGRAVLLKHDDGALTFAGNIEEGEYVRFGIGDIKTILKNGDFHSRTLLDKSQHQPETFFIYSCMARRRFIGDSIDTEINPFAKIAPTAGFFTYGEFFHSNDKNQLMNETMTVISLSEREELTHHSFESKKLKKEDNSLSHIHVISHLSNVVSNELEELNNTLEERIKENTEYIYNQAYYDILTRLPNRLKLIDDLSKYIGHYILLLNIDDFTLVNDFYGHEAGDIVLKEISSILKQYAIKKNSLVYKLPSDEFALILQRNYTDTELVKTIENILSIISKRDIIFNKSIINIDMTISAAIIKNESVGLINADMALKLAKKLSLNYMVYQESLMLSKHYESNLEMAKILRNAIDSNAITPYFQPIVNTQTGEIEKYESLARLIKDDSSILSPFAFLDMSKKIKLYPQITKIMIEKTFSYFRQNKLNFSINISFDDIQNQDTSDYIFKKIKEHSIAKQLTIEILETQEIEHELNIIEFINEVYKCGAKIAIDDFGSGYANFVHITKIRADYIKIDGSLIKNIDTDKNAKLIVETIVVFAKKLHMKTIAEFVHSKKIFDIVKELNIDFSQGYYFSEPLASTSITKVE